MSLKKQNLLQNLPLYFVNRTNCIESQDINEEKH